MENPISKNPYVVPFSPYRREDGRGEWRTGGNFGGWERRMRPGAGTHHSESLAIHEGLGTELEFRRAEELTPIPSTVGRTRVIVVSSCLWPPRREAETQLGNLVGS